MARDFDVALLGATGFTGGLTADYIAAHLPDGASWAIAGRNEAKLDTVVQRIAAAGGVAPSIVHADVTDERLLADLASRTRVLVTTVGPYLQHGAKVVKACAEAGTHYCDLTGEPEFVDQMCLDHHETAVASGAKLVHACGFDSIPYDLGVFHNVRHLPEGVPLTVRAYIRAGAEFSGGTYHSAVGAFARLRQAGKTAAARKQRESRPAGRMVRGFGDKPQRGLYGRGWALPLPTIDPQIVLRSARGLDRYGPDFSYAHFGQFKSLPMLAATVAGAGVLIAGAQLAPTRSLLLKLKNPGAGPSDEKRAASWFKLTVVGEGGGQTVVTEVTGGDPGYTETSRMLAESALCLAFDDLPDVAGQTTTAIAMGDALLNRLDFARIVPTP